MRYFENTNRSGVMTFDLQGIKAGRFMRFIKVLIENLSEFRVFSDGTTWVVEYIEDVDASFGKHFVIEDTPEISNDTIENIT